MLGIDCIISLANQMLFISIPLISKGEIINFIKIEFVGNDKGINGISIQTCNEWGFSKLETLLPA